MKAKQWTSANERALQQLYRDWAIDRPSWATDDEWREALVGSYNFARLSLAFALQDCWQVLVEATHLEQFVAWLSRKLDGR